MVPSLAFFKRLHWVSGLLAIGALWGVIAFAAMLEIRDLDLWLHLKMGEFIVQNRYVPSVDILSCSFDGKPWINHEWLFQVIVHGVQQAWGMDGLIFMQVVLVLCAFMVLFLFTYDVDRQLVVAGLSFLLLEIYQTRFTIRPDIFSLLFLALYMVILWRYLDRRWALGTVFFLQILWTNIHGYSFWGILLVGIVLGCEWIKRHAALPFEWNKEARLSDGAYRRLPWLLVLVILATFFNPLTVQGALYPLKVLFSLAGDQGIFLSNITELRPTLSWAGLWDWNDQGAYKAMILASGISFILNYRRINLAALVLWVIFLFFSLGAVRNMAYFGFVAYLICMINIAQLRLADVFPVVIKSGRFICVLGIIMSGWCAVVFLDYGKDLSLSGYYDFDRYERKSEFLGVSQRRYPNKAADFLEAQGVSGNFFNDFNSGAYLIGRLYPRIRVYMDGRTELRGGAFFKRYRKIWDEGDAGLFDEADRTCHFSGALINTTTSPASEKLLKLFSSRKEWRLVYFDYDALVFLKDTPQNAEVIRRFEIDLASWKPRELDVHRLGGSQVIPYHYLSRAHTLKSLGLYDQALLELEAALKVLPSYFGVFKLKAEIYTARADVEKAFDNWRLAAVYNPDIEGVASGLAQAYLDVGDVQGAVKQAEKAVEADPQSPAGYLVLAKAFAKSEQYEKGYDILWQALEKKSPDLKDVVLFGDMCFAGGRPDLAFRVYAAALKKDIRLIVGYQKLAQVHEAAGDLKTALMTLKRALRMDPRNSDLKKNIDRLEEKQKDGKG